MFNQFQNPQQPFYNGYAYGARPTPKCTQPVTPELQKMLNQQSNELDIRISNTDKIKNWCTHKEPTTGRIALVDNQDGTVTCRVCGETFHLVDDMKEEEVKATCQKTKDILQTAKLMFLDAPDEFIRAYSQTLSMIDKLPELYKRAYNNFTMYEAYTGSIYQSNPNVNAFAAANGILGGFNIFNQQNPYGYGYAPQQPMMYPNGYGYAQYPQAQNPMMPNQPQAPVQGQPQAPVMNPNQMSYPGGPWAMPNQAPQAATVPYVNQQGQVMPGQPMAPTTMNGNPMMPGFNPLVATGGIPGATMNAPAPTGPAPQAAAQPAATAEPTQTKTMTV